jgi:coenzyme F420-reducing hydrogenase delta subunit
VQKQANIDAAGAAETPAAKFEPRIVAFLCHYCAFAAADMAGVMRLQHPTNIRVIRLPCTGKLDVLYLLRAFEEGADGVMVAGCEEGSCHYIKGNIVAKKRVNYARGLIKLAGLEPERLRMYNLSSSMGPRFAEISREMIEHVRSLGPSQLRSGA